MGKILKVVLALVILTGGFLACDSGGGSDSGSDVTFTSKSATFTIDGTTTYTFYTWFELGEELGFNYDSGFSYKCCWKSKDLTDSIGIDIVSDTLKINDIFNQNTGYINISLGNKMYEANIINDGSYTLTITQGGTTGEIVTGTFKGMLIDLDDNTNTIAIEGTFEAIVQ